MPCFMMKIRVPTHIVAPPSSLSGDAAATQLNTVLAETLTLGDQPGDVGRLSAVN
jgi:hypothetical protein